MRDWAHVFPVLACLLAYVLVIRLTADPIAALCANVLASIITSALTWGPLGGR